MTWKECGVALLAVGWSACFTVIARGEDKVDNGSKQSVEFQNILHGGIVNHPNTAIAIARAVISDLYGDNELRCQEPLNATLNGDKWLIEGSFNQNKREGEGSVKVEIMRRDGKVVSVYKSFVLRVPSEVQEILRHDHPGAGEK